MQDWVMEILRCPVTQSPLAPASDELLADVNQRIARGNVTTKGGETVSEPLSAGLVNESKSLIYAIVEDIPNLIPDDAIVIGDLPSPSDPST